MTVIGVDHQQGMLDTFAEAAARRSLEHTEMLGDWPAAGGRTPVADVVVCYNVDYNVADLAPFASALDTHARRRVVLELPQRHPPSGMARLWRHFWGLDAHLREDESPTDHAPARTAVAAAGRVHPDPTVPDLRA